LDQRQEAIKIFCSGVESIKPDNLISRYVSLNENLLQIEKFTFDLSIIKKIYANRVGKASAVIVLLVE
jgi:hypothetical protein